MTVRIIMGKDLHEGVNRGVKECGVVGGVEFLNF